VLEAIQAGGYVLIATHPGGTVTRAAEIGEHELTRVSALDLQEPQADRLVDEMRVSGEMNVVKVALPYNGMWAVDFTRVGVDKATAARALASMLGIETSQMAAVGDSYNDLPMLRAAGLAIAMADAPEELKAVADHVCPSADHDGLATAIDEFVLPAVDS
jgi:HAD superfamily hydrolase (TIGR01484 family)